MTYNQLIKRFGSQSAAGKALGYRQSTVANWKRRGAIPVLAQLRIEVATGGALKAARGLLK